MSDLHYVPVFQIDPNDPIREHNGKRVYAAVVFNLDMWEDFEEGTYKTGDFAFAYQPHDAWDPNTRKYMDRMFEDAGMGFPCRIVDWENIAYRSNSKAGLLVYLEIDPAYAIVDRRESASNDEGTDSERAVRVDSRAVPGLEESAGVERRPPGSALAM